MHGQREVGGKRLKDDAPEEDGNQPAEKRIRRAAPSWANVIREAMLAQFVKSLLTNLEPMIRQVVNEEVANGVMQGAISLQLQRSPRMQIQPPVEIPMFRLCFTKPLSTPIFSLIKIGEEDDNPLEIAIELTPAGTRHPALTLLQFIKVEILVLDGAFSPDEHGEWTRDAFERSILKEREGKRPLIVGDTKVTIRDASPLAIPNLMFTDNSSWNKNRKFRIGAQVTAGSCGGLRIKEAVTEPFTVKDQRGNQYKKHYPPQLDDDVWRLVKIAKDGKFHKKLVDKNVRTVQDFLKLLSVRPNELKQILGPGMSDKMWEETIGHANTCEKGNKHYIFNKQDSYVVLNPICQVEAVNLDGLNCCSPKSIVDKDLKIRVDKMVLEAYEQWNSLQVFTAIPMGTDGHMLQTCSIDEASSSRLPGNEDVVVESRFQTDGFNVIGPFDQSNDHFGCGDWY